MVLQQKHGHKKKKEIQSEIFYRLSLKLLPELLRFLFPTSELHAEDRLFGRGALSDLFLPHK